MSGIFLKVLNMSITAGWIVLAVVLTRFLFKRAPKWIHCLLWGLVGLRLAVPFSIRSVLSLIPSAQTVPADIGTMAQPAIHTGIHSVNSVINPVISQNFAPTPEAGANPLQVVIFVASVVWAAGIAAMLLHALISFLRLRRGVAASLPAGEGVRACDGLASPFILGIFRPVIYVPASMEGETLDYVLRHERAHIRRRDHWWKPLGYLLLTLHWFNPLCWIAYVLLCRDIEGACDEAVIRVMDRGQTAAYSQALLDCSAPACPLAFGETGVKARVKGILNYRKPAFWVVAAALVLVAVLAVCLLTDPKPSEATPGESETRITITAVVDRVYPRSTFSVLSAPRPAETVQVGDVTVIVAESVPWKTDASAETGPAPAEDDGMLVVHAVGEYAQTYTGQFEVPTKYFSAEEAASVNVGDTIEVECDGIFLETSPMRPNRVYGAKIVKRAASRDPIAVPSRMAWVGSYVEFAEELAASCLNPDKMAISTQHHLPVFRFDTRAQLEEFLQRWWDGNKTYRGLDEIPSFPEAVSSYDDSFFKETSLIAAFIHSGSLAFRFGAGNVALQDGTCCMNVVYLNPPLMADELVAHWFLLAEVPKSYLGGAAAFDAVLHPPAKK